MKKVVKRIAALSLAGTMAVSIVSCAKKNMAVEGLEDVHYETSMDENGNEVLVDENGNIVETNANVDNKGEKKDYSKYYPLDFSTVSNNQEKFDQLIVDRDGYFKNMKSVLSLKAIHSNEEIADAIYNVVRIDSDLSNLLVKIYDETKEDIKDDIYLADQIEKLEIVLYNMKDLRDKIVNAESEYSKHLEDIVKADAEQIQRVSKYSVLPLKSPINKMEKEIKNLKEDLEEALANQN